jgi:hypothetical protein
VFGLNRPVVRACEPDWSSLRSTNRADGLYLAGVEVCIRRSLI